jgi:stearoyl-CoA desaturase (delta-9 desaturase)
MELTRTPEVAAGRWQKLKRWFVSDPGATRYAGDAPASRRIDWPRVAPFIALHLGCLAVFLVGVSAAAVVAAAVLYALRMFAITGFYHRYFSHRAFRTSRTAQFAFAFLGACSVQRGPLWWASHHRHHHAHADSPADAHSALQHGYFWSHMGWFMSEQNFVPRTELIADFARFPELRFLDRYDVVAPVALGLALFAIGHGLATFAPALRTSGPQLLAWGFCVSTVALHHATFTINSLAHRFGSRRYATRDNSRNNGWLALLTFGEGWHNNHHHFPGAARQGFYWWEFDLTYYGLRVLAALGIVWDLRQVPPCLLGARSGAGGPR